MKLLNILLIIGLIFSVTLYAREAEPTSAPNTNLEGLDITLGSIHFPRPFIHDQKDYDQGIYYITLVLKHGIPYFNVYTQTQELLFEEMAVVKQADLKTGKSKFRVKKVLLNNSEYFNLKVLTSTHRIMAFFLVKK
jgi:hypothetical protein